MAQRLTAKEVHEFWSEQARLHGESPNASWSDRMVIEMEIREILQWLQEGDRVLDVGCANGYSTVCYAAAKAISIRGLDYVEEMVAHARARTANLGGAGLAGTVEFATGNALALDEPDNTYDKVISTRVVINVGEWEQQLVAIRELCRVLKPGGLMLLSEATVQGWQKLNDFRAEWKLGPIPMPGFNNYLDEEKVANALPGQLRLVKLVNFASTYFVGTRVIKPLLVEAARPDVNAADPGMHFNRWFSEMPAWGDYGTQKLFVLEKL